MSYPKIWASRHILISFPNFLFFMMLPVLNAKCGFYKVCELVISICLRCYTGPYKFFGCTTPLDLNKMNAKQIDDAAEDQNNLEYLAKTDCKYRNLDWFNEFTEKARRNNDLSVLHLNVRSLPKNIIYLK